jgi:AcrR family transcriptional regulator
LRSKTQSAQARQRSTTAIKAAALELFAHKGYHHTSISDIARKAGISKGLMYNYFNSKEELLTSIVNDAMNSGEDILHVLEDPSLDPRLVLTQLARQSVTMVKSNLHYWKLITSLAFQTEAMKSLEVLLKNQRERNIKLAVSLFERMGSQTPMEDAYLFGATMDGIFVYYMVLEDDFPVDDIANHFINQFFTSKQQHS